MEIEGIRACIERGDFFVTDHALTEGFKDGISVADMIATIHAGRIIERYPARHRCLVFGHSADRLPIHIVIDFGGGRAIDIVTTYIPQRDQWIRGQVRKKRTR